MPTFYRIYIAVLTKRLRKDVERKEMMSPNRTEQDLGKEWGQ